MSLRTEFEEYSEEIGKEYIDHLIFILDCFNTLPPYTHCIADVLIHVCSEKGLKKPSKAMVCKIVKIIRKMTFLPYFIVADSNGYYKITDLNQGTAWRQSMIERITSMSSQVKAFDEKFNYKPESIEEVDETLKLNLA